MIIFSKQLLKFGLVGIVNTFIHYIIFIIFFRLFDINLIISSTLGYCAGLINSYIFNKIWTFQSKQSYQVSEFLKFVSVNIIALVANLITLKLFVISFHLLPEFSQLISIATAFVINFCGNKWWVFHGLHKHTNAYR